VSHWPKRTLIIVGAQIATRLLGAACPALYWSVALLLFEEEKGQQDKKGEKKREEKDASRRPGFRRAMIAYCVLYNVLGPLLHCNFLPWT
jgi:hypothetical protein